MEAIISAAITGAVTLLVCLITNSTQQAKTRSLLEYKLGELEKQVNKHNSVIERTYKLEGRMNEAEHDIKDLKSYHKPN